jgi:hypothetical protein
LATIMVWIFGAEIWVSISPFPTQPISRKSLGSALFIGIECNRVTTGYTGIIALIAIRCRATTGT